MPPAPFSENSCTELGGLVIGLSGFLAAASGDCFARVGGATEVSETFNWPSEEGLSLRRFGGGLSGVLVSLSQAGFRILRGLKGFNMTEKAELQVRARFSSMVHR